jgi:hypothetical protein
MDTLHYWMGNPGAKVDLRPSAVADWIPLDVEIGRSLNKFMLPIIFQGGSGSAEGKGQSPFGQLLRII